MDRQRNSGMENAVGHGLCVSGCGLPVVATACGGIPEVIANGENGLLVSPGDARALGDTIVRVLRDSTLADRLSVAAAETAGARFNIERTATQYASFFRSTLG